MLVFGISNLFLNQKYGASAIIILQLLAAPTPLAAKPVSYQDITKINAALKSAPLDPRLNYLAGLSYETASVMGTDKREMAKVGYMMALKGDPSFWPAHVQLGFMAMDDRDAVTAQEHFSAAAAIKSEEPVILYALARAAFCAGDLQVAEKTWQRATQLRDPQSFDELTTGAAIERQKGQFDAANMYASRIKMLGRTVPRMALQSSGAPITSEQARDPSAQTAQTDDKMGMVDLIILRRDEVQSSSSGINLLDALTLQFGSNLVNSTWRSSRDRLTGTVTNSTLDAERQLSVTVPSVTYSLNVANASGGKSTLQAQQAVLIYDGEKSNVQIGSTLTFAANGNLSSSVETMQDGLTLTIGSKFIDQDRVKLMIDASLEDFIPGAGPGSFKESVQKERTATSVTATLKFGETILISSGEQSANSRAEDKTPLLGGLPILGKLFSTRDKSTSDVSVIVLLTLRPRGSYTLPHANLTERKQFEDMRKRLLDQLDTGGEEPAPHLFQPEQSNLSYTLENPARSGDKAYLERAGLLRPF